MGNPKFAHVVLQTSDLAALRDWYCTLLNAHVVYEGQGLSFLTFDEEHHRIALLQPPVELGPKPPRAAGLHHFAYTFDHLDGLLARYAELKADGIAPYLPVQHGFTTSIYYRDPDGNYVEFQVDNFPEPADATAYMNGPEFSADVTGVTFDPEKMLAARAEGASVGELMTRSWARAACPDLPDAFEVLAKG